jgi:hypothetical protein
MFSVCSDIVGALGCDVLGALRGDVLRAFGWDVLRALGGDSLRRARGGCRFALLFGSVRSTHKCQATNQNKKSSHLLIVGFFALPEHQS